MYNIYTANSDDFDVTGIELTQVGSVNDAEAAEAFVTAHSVTPLYKGYSDQENGNHGTMFEVQTGENDYYLCDERDEEALKDWVESLLA